MRMVAIYGPNTIDHPGVFVMREWRIEADNNEPVIGPVLTLGYTLEEMRGKLPFWVDVCFPRSDSDDPSIIETWM